MIRLPFFALGLVAFAVSVACVPQPALPQVPSLTDADVAARLAATAAHRQRVDGVFKASLPGLKGVVVNATIDVAAEAPRQLSVSVRSFFEVPQQVLVANGEAVTLYDASSGAPQFFQGPANERSLQRVLGMPLWPDDAVALVLGRPPLEPHREGWPAPRVHLVSVDEAAQTYTVAIERAGRGALHWTARLSDDSLVTVVAFTGDGRRLLTATVSNTKVTEGVSFGHTVAVHLDGGNGAAEADVVLSVVDARFNGPPLPPEAFTLEPPPGHTVSPL